MIPSVQALTSINKNKSTQNTKGGWIHSCMCHSSNIQLYPRKIIWITAWLRSQNLVIGNFPPTKLYQLFLTFMDWGKKISVRKIDEQSFSLAKFYCRLPKNKIHQVKVKKTLNVLSTYLNIHFLSSIKFSLSLFFFSEFMAVMAGADWIARYI